MNVRGQRVMGQRMVGSPPQTQSLSHCTHPPHSHHHSHGNDVSSLDRARDDKGLMSSL